MAAYSFDEGSGGTVADASGKGNNGSIGSAIWSTQAKFGRALVFNGTDAHVTVPDSSSLDLTTGMTLEAWVYPLSNRAWRDVIYKGWNDIYYLVASSDSGPPAVGGISFGELKGTANLPENTWSHIAGTYDGSSIRHVRKRHAGREPSADRQHLDIQYPSDDRRRRALRAALPRQHR